MEYYLWVLVFHIMAVLSWMAMLFYQPRLYVYHTEHKDKKEFVEVVEIQEEKMYKYIGVPAMWATILSGIVMLYLQPEIMGDGWIHAKIFVVILLIAYTFSLGYFRKELKKGNFKRDGSFFRAYNEIPTILALLIVAYAITKTFSLLFTVISLAIGGFIVYKIMNKKSKKEISS
ncbi:MAG: protoporphyrinogen oxidase HemJ [Halarcobacter sp.]